MPTGEFYIDAKVSGIKEITKALKQTEDGVKDLRDGYKKVADMAAAYVRKNAPVGSSSPKDSKGHNRPGYLRGTVRSGSPQRGPWVSVGNKRTPYLIVQEFGGSSYWHRAGAGSFRAVNTAHAAVSNLGGGYIGTARHRTKGHIVYTKPRQRRGYFIWNVAWRLREPIGRVLYTEIGKACRKNGVAYTMPGQFDLGFELQTWDG